MTMKIAGLIGAAAAALVVGAAGANASVGDTGARAGIATPSIATAEAPRERGVQVAETVIIKRGGGYHRDRPFRPYFHHPRDRTVIIHR